MEEFFKVAQSLDIKEIVNVPSDHYINVPIFATDKLAPEDDNRKVDIDLPLDHPRNINDINVIRRK